MIRNNTKNQHLYYSIAYLNRVASMVAPKDEKVRLMLFRIYFSLFKKILKTEEADADKPAEEIKKYRTMSKFDNQQAKKFKGKNRKPIVNELDQ